MNTTRDASGLLFPAIDAALGTVPEGPRVRTAATTPRLVANRVRGERPAPAVAAAPVAVRRRQCETT